MYILKKCQEKEMSRIKRLIKEGKLVAYINVATLPSEADTSAQGDHPTMSVVILINRQLAVVCLREKRCCGQQ